MTTEELELIKTMCERSLNSINPILLLPIRQKYLDLLNKVNNLLVDKSLKNTVSGVEKTIA